MFYLSDWTMEYMYIYILRVGLLKQKKRKTGFMILMIDK